MAEMLRSIAQRNELVEQNLALATWAVGYFQPDAKFDDDLFDWLVGAGHEALVRAASDWNPSKGKFATYAVWWLRSFLDVARQKWRMFRLPRQFKPGEHDRLLSVASLDVMTG